jgi:cellulose synthase operon protein C
MNGKPGLLATTLLAGGLLAATPALANVDRARAAQQRGDLRAAQIELRNAVRGNPNSAEFRALLAQASLDLGDGDTAEKEARAALERGFDRVRGTALLMRAYLQLNRARDLLRDFPEPAADAPPALAATVLAFRATAHFAQNQRPEGIAAAAAAVERDPGSVQAQLAAFIAAFAQGDRAAGEAALDRALAIEPGNPDALMRKGALLFERGEFRASADTYGRVITEAPGNSVARLRRAEALMRLSDDAGARADVDAALRTAPNLPMGLFMRAMLQARGEQWREADQTLSAISQQLPNIPDGLLLLATVKRQLGQLAQAEDAARRHFARRPEDPRGAKLLAALEMQGNRPDAAAGTLTRLAQRGAADVEALDLLGRAHLAAGRPREAAQAFARAVELAPNNPALLSRLAAAQLTAGNIAGMASAAEASLQLRPDGPEARQMLAIAAFGRGDLAGAEAELNRLDPQARQGEMALVISGNLQVVRLDLAGARASFEGALRAAPQSVAARLGLVRVALMENRFEEAERLLGEALQRDPDNAEALGRVSSLLGGPRPAEARALLERAHAAHPGDQALLVTYAGALLRAGQAERAVQVLDSEAARASRRGALPLMALAEARASLGQWAEAEQASRLALAAEPGSVQARQQLANILLRRGDVRTAETLLDEGLRAAPANPALQGALIGLAQQSAGLDAALAMADRLAARPGAMPTAAVLRGDLLLGARRPAEAAEAYAAMAARAPSETLAVRQAGALGLAGRNQDAVAVLRAWLEREPNSIAVLSTLSQFDLAAGRGAEAEQALERVVAVQPRDAVSLNNLAWLLAERGGTEELARARLLAERAYYLTPTAAVADTLGWVVLRQGDAARALPLLRQAVVLSTGPQGEPDRGKSFRLALALSQTGDRAGALRLLETTLGGDARFPERAAAEQLAARLRAGG